MCVIFIFKTFSDISAEMENFTFFVRNFFQFSSSAKKRFSLDISCLARRVVYVSRFYFHEGDLDDHNGR